MASAPADRMEHGDSWILEAVEARMSEEAPISSPGPGQKALPPGTTVVIGIDVSGSTDNRRSGPAAGRRSRGAAAGEGCQTDVIIVAEVVAVCKLLARLSRHFDLRGVSVEVSVFGYSTRTILSAVLGDPEEPNRMGVAQLVRLIPARVAANYRGGDSATDLRTWLHRALGAESWLGGEAHRVLILATDGIPNYGGGPPEILADIEAVPDSAKDRLTSFIIGAGSVRTPPGSLTRSLTARRAGAADSSGGFRIDGADVPDVPALMQALGGPGAECDVQFLFRLMLFLGRSTYLPACRDYGEFLDGLEAFLEEVAPPLEPGPPALPLRRWAALLDDCCEAPLGASADRLLSAGVPCINYSGPMKTWYLLVPHPQGEALGWQVALEPLSLDVPDTAEAHPVQLPPAYRDLTYQRAWALRDRSSSILPLGGHVFAIAKSGDFWRCRELVGR